MEKNQNQNKKEATKIISQILFGLVFSLFFIFGARSASAAVCGDPLVDSRDGKSYATVQIGSQCWMKQGLNIGARIDADSDQGTVCSSAAAIQKYCYSNSDANCTANHPNLPDGGLYQWNQAMCGSTAPGAQGICPSGWHIPTHDEFTTLERAVCTSGTCATDFPFNNSTPIGYRGTNEGLALQPGSSGFEANMAGDSAYSAFVGGYFLERNGLGYFWSSTQYNATTAWHRYLRIGVGGSGRNFNSKSLGFSVRCVGVMPPSPTVNLSASPSTITQGNSSILTWSTNNATTCTANGWSGSPGTSGSQSVTPGSTTLYSLSCTGPGGTTNRSVTVIVNAVPVPTLSLSVNPGIVTLGDSATLSWTATNAVSCIASGGWSGSKSTTNDSEMVWPAQQPSTSYALQCWNSVNVSAFRIVTVTVNVSGPPTSCNLPWGGSVPSGSNVRASATSSVPCGSNCASEIRNCTNGFLSGSYANISCTESGCADCASPWGGPDIGHGFGVTASQSASVPCGSICVDEFRLCTDGSLAGSYTNKACSPQNCPVDSGNWREIAP